MGDEKYVICNVDEGDFGVFMDRNVFEGDLYCVIEGMIIGVYVIGVMKGFIYVCVEYLLVIRRLKIVLK